MKIEKINDSYVGFNENHDITTNEYYQYCVKTFNKWVSNRNIKRNFIFGNYNVDFNNDFKTIKIDIQCEHTLVKYGGRSVNSIIYGNVKHAEGYYLVRIDQYDYFNSVDCIIDYSLANIFNIESSGKFKSYMSKVVHIFPTICDLNVSNKERTNIISLFSNLNHNTRRTATMCNIKSQGVPIQIIDGCYNINSLIELYTKTKILVNIHQTDHHHTFEELRVLPALINRVVIISEESPLKDKIPYSKYIIWCNYEDIPSKTLNVLNNYDYYYKKIFLDENFSKTINEMEKYNSHSFDKLII